MPGGSVITDLDVGDVLWYSFTHPGGAFAVDTLGSTLGPDNDSELFLYNNLGTLVAANDDISASNFLSTITLGSLAAGNYFLAAGGFDTSGGAGFSVTSASTLAGNIQINGLTVVPEPGGVILALFGGLLAAPRRR